MLELYNVLYWKALWAESKNLSLKGFNVTFGNFRHNFLKKFIKSCAIAGSPESAYVVPTESLQQVIKLFVNFHFYSSALQKNSLYTHTGTLSKKASAF